MSIFSLILNDVIWSEIVIWNHRQQWKFVANFVVSSVPADGPALLGVTLLGHDNDIIVLCNCWISMSCPPISLSVICASSPHQSQWVVTAGEHEQRSGEEGNRGSLQKCYCQGKLSHVTWAAVTGTAIMVLFNSLVPGKFEWNFRYLIFQIISVIDGCDISSELALRWMSLDLTDEKSTLVQVMAWCHQATSHYLSQCWPRSLSPYGVTRPQWLKSSHCNSFEDLAPVDFIYGCLIFKWIAETWLWWHVSSTVNPTMAASWHDLFNAYLLTLIWGPYYSPIHVKLFKKKQKKPHHKYVHVFYDTGSCKSALWKLKTYLSQYHGCWWPCGARASAAMVLT